MNGGSFAACRRSWLAAVVVLAVGACTGDDGGSAGGSGPPVAPSDAPVTASDVPTTDVMRPVPTVPPSTLPGQVATDEDGVVDASPTIAPPPVDPNAPTTSAVAPTTELVGDPQPDPDSTAAPPPPPPPTAAGDPDACARLAAFDLAGVIATATGVSTSGESIGRDACRYAAGALAVEVHFVPAATFRDDWSTRDGIEPVGEVGSDAVGFGSYLPPGSPAGPGYTIAAEGGSLGVVVAVTGTADARAVAGQVAIFANQAA